MSRKISPGAFRAARKGERAGEVGIEGTTIESAEEVVLVLILTKRLDRKENRILELCRVIQLKSKLSGSGLC